MLQEAGTNCRRQSPWTSAISSGEWLMRPSTHFVQNTPSPAPFCRFFLLFFFYLLSICFLHLKAIIQIANWNNTEKGLSYCFDTTKWAFENCGRLSTYHSKRLVKHTKCQPTQRTCPGLQICSQTNRKWEHHPANLFLCVSKNEPCSACCLLLGGSPYKEFCLSHLPRKFTAWKEDLQGT